MSESVFKELCSSQKLERDRGYHSLVTYLQSLDEEGIYNLQFDLLKLLNNVDSSWETKHGALMGTKAVLENGNVSDDFEIEVKKKVMEFLDDNEFRVRIAAGEVLGALCKKVGPETYGNVKDQILQGIRSNLERDLPVDDEDDANDVDKLMQKLGSSPGSEKRVSLDAAQIFHDTAGWKSLETWMKCLESVVNACGQRFNQYVDQELLDLIWLALSHTNRFVRETGFYVCAALVSIGVTDDGKEILKLVEENSVYRYGKEISEHLGKGLADNWSQVRLAASVATRKFLHSLPSNDAKDQFFSILIPRMCLNRYYVAEGVRIYSQETWRQTTEGEGRQLVEKYIDHVVEYYIESTKADNHAVREAACACIAELGAKIDRTAVRTHIPHLLAALLICFTDDSWPVRDAACVACGNFVLCFPDESKDSLPDLYPLFFNNLQDNIASVRQGAALALANVVQAYGQTSIETITAKIKEGLEGVEKQPASSEKYSGLDKGPATYGVVKKLRDNDMDLHTDKQMYSCGSLAPKMGRGGGCMDHKFRKPSEPWELTDGCIHLLAELSNNSSLSNLVSQNLPAVAKAVSLQHYPQHVVLLETLCKQLPNIAKGIGKRHFKMHLEMFLDPIFYSMTCDSALTSSAASQCLNQLSSFLGPNILKGRVENYNPAYLDQLNANVYIAPL